jgi:serine/threonine protein kinase
VGLSELESLGIVHRDIKPDNFLYDAASKTGVIVDFGISEIYKDPKIDCLEKAYKVQ